MSLKLADRKIKRAIIYKVKHLQTNKGGKAREKNGK